MTDGMPVAYDRVTQASDTTHREVPIMGYTAEYLQRRTDLHLFAQLAERLDVLPDKINGAEYIAGGGGCDVVKVDLADGSILSVDDWATPAPGGDGPAWSAILYASEYDFDLGHNEGMIEVASHAILPALPGTLSPAAALGAFVAQADTAAFAIEYGPDDD